MRSSVPKVTELFAGAGLFGYAFAQVGFSITRAIEIDPVAAQTYAANLGDYVEVTDVRHAEPDPSEPCDVLIAGPPCQGFSTLGSRSAADPRNGLCFEVARWARVLKPQIVVIENVEAFVNSPEWISLGRRLRRAGYVVESHVLNAFDYGVPQLRRRSFTFALRPGAVIRLPRPRRAVRTVRQAWQGLPRTPDGRNAHVAPAPSDIASARMRVIPPGGDKRDVMRFAPDLAPPSWWRTTAEVTDVWGRMEWDKPCNTLRTACQNPSKGRYIHPDQNRVISLREAARLQSIPDTWQFVGLPTQIARQIGNSVPPALGRAVARAVLRTIGASIRRCRDSCP